MKTVAKSADEVYIVTGPLYVPKASPDGKGYIMAHPMIGEPPRMVAVPTHFFKVVLAERSGMLGQQVRCIKPQARQRQVWAGLQC